mgnify:CR=1 FL=1
MGVRTSIYPADQQPCWPIKKIGESDMMLLVMYVLELKRKKDLR